MSKILVKPQGSKWIVMKNGRTVSTHRKKSRAKKSAKSKASAGDRIETRRKNGTIQSTRTVR